MNKKLMDKIIEAFKSNGSISEQYIIDHGSTLKGVLNVFKGNQYVCARVCEISKRKYVTGRLLKNEQDESKELPLTLQNYNNEAYMAEELPKHEGNN